MLSEILSQLLATRDLPEPPPPSPMNLLVEWFDDARTSERYDDPNAMGLATSTTEGVPSVRMVLCKGIDVENGELTFFTNYQSRKGRELTANPQAAALFHWPHAKRQARVEGVVERLPAHESDAYFNSRPLLSRIGACVSPQSTPIDSSAELVENALRLARSVALGGSLTRPDWWGGYRLRIVAAELWSGRGGRLHQRVRWARAMTSPSDSPAEWRVSLLAP